MMYVGPIGLDIDIDDTSDQDELEAVKDRLNKAVARLPRGEARSVLNFVIGAIDSRKARARARRYIAQLRAREYRHPLPLRHGNDLTAK